MADSDSDDEQLAPVQQQPPPPPAGQQQPPADPNALLLQQLAQQQQQLAQQQQMMLQMLQILQAQQQPPPQLAITESPTKKQKTAWTTTVTTVKALQYSQKQASFTLNASYLSDSGLAPCGPLILHCRKPFRKQFKFLQMDVMKDNCLGWILGPPGTGKSTTTLAFASTITNEWVVTWIHLSRVQLPSCVRYEGETRKKYEIREQSYADELNHVLNEVEKDRQHFVILDGLVFDASKHVDVLSWCIAWRQDDRKNRRLVVVSSMSVRSKSNAEEDLRNKVKVFFVYSWTLEQYLAAVQDKAFFDNIKVNLDSSDDNVEQASRKNLIVSKFYFAGGSSRFMFLLKTAAIIEMLTESVATVKDILPYIKGEIGEISSDVVNRLLGSYPKPGNAGSVDRHTSIVSPWAASQIAMKRGPDLVRSLAEVTGKNKNPAMDGWMFEMWFFSLLSERGVQLYGRDGNREELWPLSVVNPLSEVPALSDEYGVWLKPRKWNQGGYDAIFIDKAQGLVRFVHVTRAVKRHALKIEFFAEFLSQLRTRTAMVHVNTVEIIFLVDQKNINTFQIHPVSGQGLLTDYGWEEGKEAKTARTVGITGWNVSE